MGENTFHSQFTILEGIHGAVAYVYATEAERLAATGFTAVDENKIAKVTENNKVYLLTSTSPITWEWLNAQGFDINAIHVNESGEISGIDEKAVPAVNDIIVAEDLADSNNKKKIQLGNIPLSDKALIDFIPGVAPSHKEGRLFYDSSKKALTYFNDVSNVALNIGQEFYVRAQNQTGFTIPNGSVVYINGANSGMPTVELADAKEFSKSRVIGMATHNILNNGIGYITRAGAVADVDTSSCVVGDVIYLDPDSPGQFTKVRPIGGNFVVEVGRVLTVNPSTGSIMITVDISEYTAETNSKTGWPSNTEVEISFDDGTRTLSVNPSGANPSYRYYQNGVKFIKSSDQIILPDIEAVFLVYYDGDSLAYIQDPNSQQTVAVILGNTTVAYVYWNATDNRAEYLLKELHAISFNTSVHVYLHFVLGAQFITGLGLTDIVPDASGDLDIHAQFGVEAGRIVDEDVPSVTPDILSTTGLPIFYLTGSEANPSLRRTTNAGFSVLPTGTGRLAFNELTGGNWQLSEVLNNNFVLCHVFAFNENDISKRVITIIGQNEYVNLADARSGASTEITSLILSGIVGPELVPVATVIFQSGNGYANAVKARVVTTDLGDDYIDWRTEPLVGGGSAGGGGSIFSDVDFMIFNSADLTKEMQFNLANITAGQNRILSIPDKSGTLALLNDTTNYFFHASIFSNPNNANWAVNALAPVGVDFYNKALRVRRFDDTLEEGVGFLIEIPSWATNIIFDIKSRAEIAAATNINVVPKLYVREILDNLAVGAWSAGLVMTTLAMGNSNVFYQYDSQTMTLTSLGLTAGRIAQFELTRDGSNASDNLAGDWSLLSIRVRFS